jgi:hypothetical protein
MRRRLDSPAPLAIAAAWLAACYGLLLSPRWALGGRDVPLFHLPLRAVFRTLVLHGSAGWNPFLNGGQPLLSNPSYSAFYPPVWLVLPLPASYELNLLVVLHAALAYGGAWRLARRLGAGRGAAALAAVGYSGSGMMLSLTSPLKMLFCMAWLPWLLGWGDQVLRARGRRAWIRPALLLAMALAMQLLNAEPTTLVVSALALAALALSAAWRAAAGSAEAPEAREEVPRSADRRAAAGSAEGVEARETEVRRLAAWRAGAGAVLRLLPALLLAAALAAVQLVPAAHRLAASPRAGGLPYERATLWSAPPARAVELVLPRFFGDPARVGEGLFFGGRLHDRGYPYVVSIYPGLLLTLLGISALAAWPVPRRAAWVLIAALGAALALGRHDPLYAVLLRAAPLLGKLRYPDKFAVMTVTALTFAGALGWQRLLAARQAGRRQAADLPLALALLLLAAAAGLTVVLHAAPAVGVRFIAAHSAPPPGPELLARALLSLRAEGWAAVAAAAATAGLFALYRSPRVGNRGLSLLALGLLAADLLHYGRGLLVLVPAEVYAAPPAAAWELLPRPEQGEPGALADRRLFVEPGSPTEAPLAAAEGDPELALLRTQLGSLEPYSGLLWGLPYALNFDFDLLLTPWAARAVEILAAERALRPDLVGPYLGAWNVGAVARAKDPRAWAAELARDPRAPPVELAANPFCLPRYRFVPRVAFHATFGTALAAARAGRYAAGAEEHCWRPWAGPAQAEYAGAARLLQVFDRGGRIELRYRAADRAFLTAANSFDPGWRAHVDGVAVAVLPTAACQLGIELPAGEHRLQLDYADRAVGVGAWISAVALAAWALLLLGVRAAGKSDAL